MSCQGAYTFEVALKHSHKVILVMDLPRWEVLEPGSSGVQ
jgi:hypothetical protein